MAELAALGLASNIVQFIDFGITLFHEGKEIYESSEGSSAKRLELETITADLRDIVHELQPTIHPVTKDDAALGRLAKDCEKLATDLLCLLDKLKVKESQHPKWASFKQALNSVLKEGAIRNLESRLEKCRDQLGKRLLYMLRFVVPISFPNLNGTSNLCSATNSLPYYRPFKTSKTRTGVSAPTLRRNWTISSSNYWDKRKQAIMLK